MKKEVKIGIYAVVILLCAWAGIRFLSGLDVFGRTRNYTAHYEQVNGLQDAAAVVINGVKVGQVTGVALDVENGGVDVTLSVNKAYNIPTDSKAMMFSAGLMGGKSIEIVLGSSTEMLKNGDVYLANINTDTFLKINLGKYQYEPNICINMRDQDDKLSQELEIFKNGLIRNIEINYIVDFKEYPKLIINGQRTKLLKYLYNCFFTHFF